MRFKNWLLSEMRHYNLENTPIHLRINGNMKVVTGIDFRWEDFGQQDLGARYFVQEFPDGVGEPGQVFVNGGFWDGYWTETINPGDLHRLRHSDKVFGDVDFKKLIFGEAPPLGHGRPPTKFDVNPLNKFVKIDPESIKDHDGSPAKFRSPYDKKVFLNWWDFAEVLNGQEVLKPPARVR